MLSVCKLRQNTIKFTTACLLEFLISYPFPFMHRTESVVGNGNNGSKAKHFIDKSAANDARASKNRLLLIQRTRRRHFTQQPLLHSHRRISDSPEHNVAAEEIQFPKEQKELRAKIGDEDIDMDTLDYGNNVATASG
ncbi:unnamed protein product [Ceratitis capitata]|uniref:(Mediterranean fruit fly) hypothetical protein n=1 Tax=Ceratitis capitata TaxID=7213 RepID=A0A811U150_CERCA|nr:unnamed protein product [Ceratitis capitata]